MREREEKEKINKYEKKMRWNISSEIFEQVNNVIGKKKFLPQYEKKKSKFFRNGKKKTRLIDYMKKKAKEKLLGEINTELFFLFIKDLIIREIPDSIFEKVSRNKNHDTGLLSLIISDYVGISQEECLLLTCLFFIVIDRKNIRILESQICVPEIKDYRQIEEITRNMKEKLKLDHNKNSLVLLSIIIDYKIFMKREIKDITDIKESVSCPYFRFISFAMDSPLVSHI